MQMASRGPGLEGWARLFVQWAGTAIFIHSVKGHSIWAWLVRSDQVEVSAACLTLHIQVGFLRWPAVMRALLLLTACH